MHDALRVIAAASAGLVTSQDVTRTDVPRSAVRWALECGDLVSLRPGAWCDAAVWAAADPRGRHRLAVAAAQRQRPRAVAVAQSAAVLLDLPLPADPPPAPLLLEPRDSTRRGGDGGPRGLARRAWLDDSEVTSTHDGLRVTSSQRTVVDLARHLELPWALAAADAAMSRGTTREQLLTAAERNPCAPGHLRAVVVAHRADPRPESPLESLARGVLIDLGVTAAEPQRWVRTSSGRYRVDLVLAEWRTIVEADGKVKYVDPWLALAPGEKDWQDKLRRDHLLEEGYEVVRFVMADARRPLAWGRRLARAALRAHVRSGTPTSPDLVRFAAEMAVNWP